MELTRIYELVDAKPFRSFAIDLVNGRRVNVDHPENIHFLPGRQRVKEIWVYYPGSDSYSIVFPEGITALHVPVTAADGGDA